jgi:hypothetical protein
MTTKYIVSHDQDKKKMCIIHDQIRYIQCTLHVHYQSVIL